MIAASVTSAQTPAAFTVNNTIPGADTTDFLVNGVNKVKIDSMGTLTLNGTALAGSGGGNWTFRNTPPDDVVGDATTDVFTNKTFDTAGSGNVFKINSTAISAVTGTGSAVLSGSPTLTGTPAAPTNSSASDSSTQIATDAFVQNVISTGNNTLGGATTFTGAVNGITPFGGSCAGFSIFCADYPPRSAAIGSAPFFTSTGTAVLLRVTYYFAQTQAPTTSSTITLGIAWQDTGSGTYHEITEVLSCPNPPTNCVAGDDNNYGILTGVFSIWVDQSNTVKANYVVGYSSSGATAAQYMLHLRVEQM